MKKPVFRGSAVALITPYTKDGSAVDFEAYGVLIDRQIALGTAALVVCATTGEAPTLTDDGEGAIEAVADPKEDTYDFTNTYETKGKTVIGGVKVLEGRELKDGEFTFELKDAGLYAQYAHIAAHVDLPIILYNVPSRTSVCIGAETYEKLSKIMFAGEPEIVMPMEFEPEDYQNARRRTDSCLCKRCCKGIEPDQNHWQ